MGNPSAARSQRALSLNLALWLLAGCVALLGAVQLALVLPSAGDLWWLHLLLMVDFWVYVAAGILAWRRRPSNRMGPLIVVGGFAVYAASLANTGIPGLDVLGVIFATTVLAVTIHLLHAFPSGRLRGRASLMTVIAAYGVSLVLQAPLYLFDGAAPEPLVIADRPDLLMAGEWVQRAAGLAVAVATAVILARRLVRADPPHRRVLGPLFAYGMLAVLFIPARSTVIEPLLGLSPITSTALQFIVLAGVPIAFALGVLRGGFARTGELEELSAWLGDTGGARPALVDALRRVLGDDSVELVFWLQESERWVDGAGASTTLPDPGSGRSSVEILLAGERVGAIAYDAALIGDPAWVSAAGRVIAIAVERERLLTALLASQGALISSRARLVAAADRERRRIAGNLHDGLQVQLVLLALEAQQIANAAGSTDSTREHATALRKGIDSAAAELRRLVHEVMPSTLIERGLSAATEDLVDRMPVPTRLQLNVEDGAVPAWIESTAYFLVAEGLVNALKHSRAQSFAVRLEREDDLLLVEISDDGVGGASFEAGSGLRGLADRVDVVGGRLKLISAPGDGTRLMAELPCAS
jgi:signal transduction histidine kinase